MRVLGLDTSTARLSAAVLEDGGLVAECVRESAPPKDRRPGRSNHAEGLIPIIEEVLQRAGAGFSSLSLVGVAVGPGSFTGLRIGISTVKGLVYGSDTPVVGIPTLEAMAYRMPGPDDGAAFICPLLDARKGEVYGSLYRRTAAAFECRMEDCLAPPESMVRRVSGLAKGPCVFVGAGAQAHADVIRRCTGGHARIMAGTDLPSTASAVAGIAEGRYRTAPAIAAEPLIPRYIRPPDAAAGKPPGSGSRVSPPHS